MHPIFRERSLALCVRDLFLFGCVRHLHDLKINQTSKELSASLTLMHSGHPSKMETFMEWAPTIQGQLSIEKEGQSFERGETPLQIKWHFDKESGLLIDAIEGTVGGVEAHFHAQTQNDLVERLRLDFGFLSDLLPSRWGQVFHQLKMGKGYEMKGVFHYDGKDRTKCFLRDF